MSADLLAPATLVSIALGVCLAAACGLRIFIPLLIASIAAHTGHLQLQPGTAWIGTTPALVVFSVATLLELAAYKVPWLDNLLDVLGAPVAVAAGTVLAASPVTGLDPMVRWTLAVIAGGGAAGAVHGALALTRKTSSLTTGGLANPLLAAAEAVGAVVVAVLALLVPVLTVLVVIGLFAGTIRLRQRWRARRAARSA